MKTVVAVFAVVCCAVVAPPASADVGVQTGAPSAVSWLWASASYTVTSDGPFTSYVEWGETTGYGRSEPTWGREFGGVATREFSIADLKPGTTYHYRAVVRTWNPGTGAFGPLVYGEDRIVETLPAAAPTIRDVGVPGYGDGGASGTGWAEVHATIDPNGFPPTLRVLYGITPALGSVSDVVDPNPKVAPPEHYVFLQNLQLGTTYYYSVVATNAAGTTVSPVATFKTSGVEARTPGAPTAVSAVAGDRRATVSFAPPPASFPLNAVYVVTASPGGAAAAGLGSPIVVSGLDNGTSYTFTVTAINDSVYRGPPSSPSNAVIPTAATPPPPPTPTDPAPSAPAEPVPPAPVEPATPATGVPAPAQPRPTVVAAVTLSVTAPRTLALSVRKPSLPLTIRSNRGATVAVSLRDAHGSDVARWRSTLRAGTSKIVLPLPARARRPGRYTVRVAVVGGAGPQSKPKSLPLVLRK